MADLTSRAALEHLLDTFGRSAWRLECQGTYDEPEEREPLRQFLAGEPDDLAWYMDWPEWVREVRASGRTIGRVRVLTDPLTDYLRWEIGVLTPPAVEAGEDIRVLPAAVWPGLQLPSTDFWLFDDSTAAVLHFGDQGVSGVELITGAEIESYRERQRRATAAAVSFNQWRAGGA